MAEQTAPSDPSGFDIEWLLEQARTYLAQCAHREIV